MKKMLALDVRLNKMGLRVSSICTLPWSFRISVDLDLKVSLSFSCLTFTFMAIFYSYFFLALYVYVCMSVCICVCVGVCVHVCACMCVCVWLCVRVCFLSCLSLHQSLDIKYTHPFVKVFSSFPSSQLNSKTKPCPTPSTPSTSSELTHFPPFSFLRSWRLSKEKWKLLGQQQ